MIRDTFVAEGQESELLAVSSPVELGTQVTEGFRCDTYVTPTVDFLLRRMQALGLGIDTSLVKPTLMT